MSLDIESLLILFKVSENDIHQSNPSTLVPQMTMIRGGHRQDFSLVSFPANREMFLGPNLAIFKLVRYLLPEFSNHPTLLYLLNILESLVSKLQ